jgi:ribosomal protein S18 acetylase RimI-like enzyme
VRLGALEESDRGRLREILDATAVFRPEEVSIALELFDDTLRTAHVGQPPTAGSRAAASAPLDYEFVGAFADDGSLIGYACYGATPATDRTYDLYWIATHPIAQGSGAGSRLLGEVEQRLRARNGRLLVVETSSREEYAPTRRFYTRRGYDEIARLRDFYAPFDDRVIYTKRLDHTSNGASRSPGADAHEVRSPKSQSEVRSVVSPTSRRSSVDE